MLTRLKG